MKYVIKEKKIGCSPVFFLTLSQNFYEEASEFCYNKRKFRNTWKEIMEEPKDFNLAVDVIMLAGTLLLQSGSEIYRVEDTMHTRKGLLIALH